MNAVLSLVDELEILLDVYERLSAECYARSKQGNGLASTSGYIEHTRGSVYEQCASDLRRVLRVNGIA